MDKYAGLWVTEDGHIRQELRADGRCVEARGHVNSAYTGRYEIEGTHIHFWDDTGFQAEGDFEGNDILHHIGLRFHRRENDVKGL